MRSRTDHVPAVVDSETVHQRDDQPLPGLPYPGEK